MKPQAAVLTGDLIGSTRASNAQVDASMNAISICAMEFGSETRFTRSRGDGWQMVLEQWGQCLHACLLIQARLRSDPFLLGSRVAVGIGAAIPFDPTTLHNATGEAFIASGRALSRMEKSETLVIAGDEVDAFKQQCFVFAADYARRWSRDQATAMGYALSRTKPTQDEIAERLGITRQAVGARLKAAGFRILWDTTQIFLAASHFESPPHD